MRGNLDRLVSVWQRAERPLLVGTNWAEVDNAGNETAVCASEFKKLFGFVPGPGECIKVEF